MRRFNAKSQQRTFICRAENTPQGNRLICSVVSEKEEARTFYAETQCSGAQCNGNCTRDPCLQLTYFPGTENGISFDLYNSYRAYPGVALKVLPERIDYCFRISDVAPGTQADPRSLVYGYQADGLSLDLRGGMRGSYPCSFRKFKIQYLGAPESQLVAYTPSTIKKAYTRIVSYFAQRGFPFPQKDQPAEYKDIWVNGNSGRRPDIRFGPKVHGVPLYLDLYVGGSNDVLPASTHQRYDPNTSNRVNGGLYPVRIPITQDFCGEFNTKYDTEPIAYYDCLEGVLTIQVPELANFPGYLVLQSRAVFGIVNEQIDVYLMSYLNSFSLLKRDQNNQFVKATFNDVEVFAQAMMEGRYKVNLKNLGPAIASPPLVVGDNIFDQFVPILGGPGVRVDAPSSAAGTYDVAIAGFGPLSFDVSGEIAASIPDIGVPVITNNLTGKIALIVRGGGTFAAKALAAQAAGAIGVILYNSGPGGLAPGGSAPGLIIPCVGITRNLGLAILAGLPATGRLSNALLGYYVGAVLQPMGGSNANYNVNAFPGGVNANVTGFGPNQSQIVEFEDNPSTRYQEGRNTLSATNCYDNDVYRQQERLFPLAFVKGSHYPEQAASAPLPQAVTDPAEGVFGVLVHEYVHITNGASGGIGFVPTEAMATSIEQDPAIVGGSRSPTRAIESVQTLVGFNRGNFNIAYPERLVPAVNGATYGMYFIWSYLREQFDHNNQVMRRLCDLMASEEISNAMEAINVIMEQPRNYAETNIRLEQALFELFGKSLKQVVFDFSVAMCLFRNNKSIPRQYQTDSPFWIFNSDYAGIADWTAAQTGGPGVPYTTWWETLDKNLPMPVTYTGGTIPTGSQGQTFIKELPFNKAGSITNVVRTATTLTFSVASGLTGAFVVGAFVTVTGLNISVYNISSLPITAATATTFTVAAAVPVQTTPFDPTLISVATIVSPVSNVVTSITSQDMKTYSFTGPRTTNSVSINVTSGDWMIGLFQFTSDGTPQGSFIMDGPHNLNGSGSLNLQIAAHVPAFTLTGHIRLVCCNTTITDQGIELNMLGAIVNSGQLSITRSN